MCGGTLPFIESMRNWSIPVCGGTGVRVYPRVCGGTRYIRTLIDPTEGLSPRVRGNQALEPQARKAYRSIPACAGEPSHGGRCAEKAAVYPRVCGGTETFADRIHRVVGLSPRVRGNRSGRQPPCFPSRSIPACAGEPAMLWSLIDTRWVYPRVCGGTTGVGVAASASRGLSPRVRGNLRTCTDISI